MKPTNQVKRDVAKLNGQCSLAAAPLLEAKRRYVNARRRARYWSSTPNFNQSLRSIECSSSRLDEKYELAMCDCLSWEQKIEELTGQRPEHYDPKAEFAKAFVKALASNAQAQAQPK
jgi:hypothetical protein